MTAEAIEKPIMHSLSGGEKSRSKHSNIVGLHYIRAIATLFVVVVHSVADVSNERYFGPGIFSGFYYGGAGEIDLFFVMSGFLMFNVTHDGVTWLPRTTAREFLRKRFIRILPMFWFAVISYNVLLFARYGISGFSATGIIKTLSFWPTGSTLPFVAWTVRYEVFFYIIFCICFIYKPKLKFVAVLWFLSPIMRHLLDSGKESVYFFSEELDLSMFVFSPFNIDFGIGVGLALFYRFIGDRIQNVAAFRDKHQLFIFICIFILMRILVKTLGLEVGTVPMVLLVAPFAVCMVLLALYTKPTEVSPSWMLLGDASYSIFLLHPFFILIMLFLMSRFTPWMPSSAAALLTLTVSVAGSCVAHFWVELPLTAWVGARYKKG